MEFQLTTRWPETACSWARLGALAVVGLVIVGCNQPPPRTFTEFMEDRIAREGTLARCNQDRDATINDIECANARRAAATIALSEERERREELERESEQKLAALRDQIARRDQAKREALAAAIAAAEAAYEAQWADADAASLLDGNVSPTLGAQLFDDSRDSTGPAPAQAADPANQFGAPIAPAAIQPGVQDPQLDSSNTPVESGIPRPFRRAE